MDYLIQYSALSDCRKVLKQGKMKVKNKHSELHAKSSLEDYFKKKFYDFDKLIIYKCQIVTVLDDILESGSIDMLFNNLGK